MSTKITKLLNISALSLVSGTILASLLASPANANMLGGGENMPAEDCSFFIEFGGGYEFESKGKFKSTTLNTNTYTGTLTGTAGDATWSDPVKGTTTLSEAVQPKTPRGFVGMGSIGRNWGPMAASVAFSYSNPKYEPSTSNNNNDGSGPLGNLNSDKFRITFKPEYYLMRPSVGGMGVSVFGQLGYLHTASKFVFDKAFNDTYSTVYTGVTTPLSSSTGVYNKDSNNKFGVGSFVNTSTKLQTQNSFLYGGGAAISTKLSNAAEIRIAYTIENVPARKGLDSDLMLATSSTGAVTAAVAQVGKQGDTDYKAAVPQTQIVKREIASLPKGTGETKTGYSQRGEVSLRFMLDGLNNEPVMPTA